MENMNIDMEESARCAPLIAEESSIGKRHCSVYVITRAASKRIGNCLY